MLSPIQELKIVLMTEGMVVSPAAREALSGPEDRRPMTLADYASTSGISMELEAKIWVNAPIAQYNPNFVRAPRCTLDVTPTGFQVVVGDVRVKARPTPVPSYHDQRNPWGVSYTDVAITHTDRVRISPISGCALTCQFCDVPYELRYARKPLDHLVESVTRALADATLPARHVLVSGGTPRSEDYEYLNEVYSSVCTAHPDVAIDVMMAPMPGLLDARRLRDVGIHGLSINMELNDEERARKVMHGKWRMGRRHLLDFIAGAVEVFGPGRVRSLLMVGIESVEETLLGVRALAERGCDPVLSPFRPDPSTPMREEPPPSIGMLRDVYMRSAEIVEMHGVKLGPRCIPCMHNTLTFPDGSDAYYTS